MDGTRLIQRLFLIIFSFTHAQNSETCNRIELTPDEITYHQFKNTNKDGLRYIYQLLVPHNLIVTSPSVDLQQVKRANMVLKFKARNNYKNNYAAVVSENYVHFDENKKLIAIVSESKEQFGHISDANTNFMSFFIQSKHTEEDFKKKLTSIELHLYTDVSRDDCGLAIQKRPEVSISLVQIDNDQEGASGKVEINVDWGTGDDNVVTYPLKGNLGPRMPLVFCNHLGYLHGKKISSQRLEKTKGFFDLGDPECLDFMNNFLFGPSEKEKEVIKRIDSLSDNAKNTFCMKQIKTEPLAIKCTEHIDLTTGLSLQSSGDTCNIGKCTLGYHLDSTSADRICVPNICHCENGSPVESNYDFVIDTCGLTVEPLFETQVESDKDGDPNLGSNSDSESKKRRKKRMTGGQEFSTKALPFQTQLYTFKDTLTESHCSSAIINPKFVITAAHCCYLGRQALSEIFVSPDRLPGKCKVHENYVDEKEAKKTRNDIALIEILPSRQVGDKYLQFSERVRPICLSDQPEASLLEAAKEGETVVITGKETSHDNDLAMLDYTISELSECDIDNSDPNKDGRLCAKAINPDINVSTCQGTQRGDSGGPLMRKTLATNSHGAFVEKWELIGLVSFGADCEMNAENTYTVFTSISHFFQWIDKTIIDLSPNQDDGRFCAIDDTVDCKTCEQGYTLEGKNCVEDFDVGDMGTLTNFFEGNYCSDQCSQFMYCENKEEESGRSARSVRSTPTETTIKFNKCTCNNGQPRNKCYSKQLQKEKFKGSEESCDPEGCFSGFRHDSSQDKCVPSYVQIATDFDSIVDYLISKCPDQDNAEILNSDTWCKKLLSEPFTACDEKAKVTSHYYDCISNLCIKDPTQWSDSICEVLQNFEKECNKYPTENNSLVNGDSWRSKDFCSLNRDCEGNYHRNLQGQCVPNKCYCEHGKPVEDKDCTEHNKNQCESCDEVSQDGEQVMKSKYEIYDTVSSTQMTSTSNPNFFEAYNFCNSKGMKLATVKNIEENTILHKVMETRWNHLFGSVYNDLPSKDSMTVQYYLGARKAEGYPGSHANGFFWLTTENKVLNEGRTSEYQVSYANTWQSWAAYQPDNIDNECVFVQGARNTSSTEISGSDIFQSDWYNINCYENSKDNSFFIGAACEKPYYECTKISEFESGEYSRDNYNNDDDYTGQICNDLDNSQPCPSSYFCNYQNEKCEKCPITPSTNTYKSPYNSPYCDVTNGGYDLKTFNKCCEKCRGNQPICNFTACECPNNATLFENQNGDGGSYCNLEAEDGCICKLVAFQDFRFGHKDCDLSFDEKQNNEIEKGDSSGNPELQSGTGIATTKKPVTLTVSADPNSRDTVEENSSGGSNLRSFLAQVLP